MKNIFREMLNLVNQPQYNIKKCQKLLCLSKIYQKKIIKYHMNELLITR